MPLLGVQLPQSHVNTDDIQQCVEENDGVKADVNSRKKKDNGNTHMQDLEEDEGKMNVDVQRLLEENNNVKGYAQHLESEICSLKTNNELLKTEKYEIEEKLQLFLVNGALMYGELRCLEETKDERRAMIQSLEEEKDNLNTELQRLLEEKYRMNAEIQRLQQEKDNMSIDIRHIKVINDNMDKKVSRILLENIEKSTEIRLLQEKNDGMSTDVKRLQQEKDEMNAVVQRLRGEIDGMNTNLRRLQGENNNLTKKLEEEKHNFMVEKGSVVVSDEVLGKGGWGVVYAGDFHGTRVAVKEFHEVILSSYNIRILQREINIAAQCRHPNLLQFICAAKNDNDHLLIVTELMDMSLRALTEQRAVAKSRLVDQEVKSISLDVARGLNYLHSKHPKPIIHRDVSSVNVLLQIASSGVVRAKVSDYGSANFMQVCKTANPGAVLYAAPDASNAKYDPKVIYTYSIILKVPALLVLCMYFIYFARNSLAKFVLIL